MKKLLMVFAVSLLGTGMVLAQNIGILGASTPAGWNADLDMTTTDNVTYTYQGLVIVVPDADPGVKFRQDDAWTINWGGSGFPTGTASLNGPNIPAVNGTYDVTFNISTLEYSFVPSGVEYDDVAVVGDDVDISLTTLDGVMYYDDFVTFAEDTDVAFMVNDSETGWGGSGFPSGTAVEGETISVPANAYNIDFNLDTKAYSFEFITISLIGAGVVTEDPAWTTDVNLTTTDGKNYTLLNHTFPGGEGKFRANNNWDYPGWTSPDFPSGTAVNEGSNMVIPAGTYDVTFNRETGAFAFTESTAGVQDFAVTKVTVFPNPTQHVWNFTASQAIDAISVVDISGKVVYTGNSAIVNASGLASGIYFAKVASGNAVATVKVVKN